MRRMLMQREAWLLSQCEGRRARRITLALWAIAVVGGAVVCFGGLLLTPADKVQGELVRIIYVHPATAFLMYVAFAVTTAASVLQLIAPSARRGWDTIAGASAEVGIVFCALALLTGAIWGRGAWGVWWTWDARLTSTAVLFVLYLGYLALRQSNDDVDIAAKRSAFMAIFAAIDIPIVHFSVEWWRTLHQDATLQIGESHIGGTQLVFLLLSFFVGSVLYAYLLHLRVRLAVLQETNNRRAQSEAIVKRLQQREHAQSPRNATQLHTHPEGAS